MIETQVRALFADIAGEPAPSQVDTGLAHRRGRARLRWRRAGQAGAPVLAAVAAAAVALAVGTAPFRPGPGPATAPVAPRQFNPLVPYASFGWLPAGESLQDGGSARTLGYQDAGAGPANAPWVLQAYSNGHCQLTGPARTLRCGVGKIGDVVLRLRGRAPAVHGRPAFWARSRRAPADGYLVWQYARGGWALLSWHDPQSPGFAWQPHAVRIADHARFGAHAAPPLAFPVRLTSVPASWQVSSVMYIPQGAVLLASQYVVTAGPAILPPFGEYRPGTPSLFTQASAHAECYAVPNRYWTDKIIGGHRVLVANHDTTSGQPGQWLCAKDADGLWVAVTVFGKHPVLGVTGLFAHHLQLLGPDPAHWTRNPIG